MRFLLVLVIGGGFLIFLGGREWWVSSGAGDKPVEVDLAKLEAGEAPPNNYVAVKEGIALYPALVYSYPKNKYDANKEPTPDTSINYAYYPIISTEHPFVRDMKAAVAQPAGPDALNVPVPKDFRVLVKTYKFKKIRDVPIRFDALKNTEGLVINSISSLDNDEEKMIKESFPQLDTKRMLIIEEGRQPASPLKSFGMMGGGVALIAVAGFLFLRSRNQ